MIPCEKQIREFRALERQLQRAAERSDPLLLHEYARQFGNVRWCIYRLSHGMSLEPNIDIEKEVLAKELYEKNYGNHFALPLERATNHARLHESVVVQVYMKHLGATVTGRLEDFRGCLLDNMRIRYIVTPVKLDESLVIAGYEGLYNHCEDCQELCEAYLTRERLFILEAMTDDTARSFLDEAEGDTR